MTRSGRSSCRDLERAPAVGRLAGDLERGVRVQREPQKTTKVYVIVDEQHARRRSGHHQALSEAAGCR